MKDAIGVIGGMGPLASQLFYKMITEHTAAERDYKVDDMLLREVNGELVRKFDLYLKTEKHCAQSS